MSLNVPQTILSMVPPTAAVTLMRTIVNPNMHKQKCADHSAPLELVPEWGAL